MRKTTIEEIRKSEEVNECDAHCDRCSFALKAMLSSLSFFPSKYPYAFIVNRDIIRCEILRLKKS